MGEKCKKILYMNALSSQTDRSALYTLSAMEIIELWGKLTDRNELTIRHKLAHKG